FSTVLTSFGASAFHAERRWRVFERDILRLGTAMMLSFLLAFRIGMPIHVFIFSQQPGQRSPPRINRGGLACSLSIAQLTGLRVETRAIWAAHGLKRQCKHYRVSERGFKIHV